MRIIRLFATLILPSVHGQNVLCIMSTIFHLN